MQLDGPSNVRIHETISIFQGLDLLFLRCVSEKHANSKDLAVTEFAVLVDVHYGLVQMANLPYSSRLELRLQDATLKDINQLMQSLRYHAPTSDASRNDQTFKLVIELDAFGQHVTKEISLEYKYNV